MIKICGIRDSEAARAAEEAGADLIGFILSPVSRRYVEPERAAAICRGLSRVKKVGVFVNEPVEYVNNTAKLCGLDYIQLHGQETAGYALKITYPLIKAFRYGDDFSPEVANRYPAAFILLDSFAKGKFGGTGRAFSWRSAATEAGRLTKPFFVAGGISSENALEAVRIFRPAGLDVSGSLEDAAGNKSPQKIRAFIELLKKEPTKRLENRHGERNERYSYRNSGKEAENR